MGDDRSLFLGFGDIILVPNPRGAAPHGEWELGTYRSAWRMIQQREIICGSKDVVDSLDEIRNQLVKANGLKCIGIGLLTEFDVRVEFENSIWVDFLGTFSDDDEVLNVFLPKEYVVSFSIREGWLSHPIDA